jgi:8-oxo-dGTP diphosphatase
MKNKRPFIGVAIIIVKDNKVLLLKRKGSHGAGTWNFPGGHLEFNEKVATCALREVKEEAGIEIENLRYASYTNDIFKKEKKHYVTLFIIADWKSGKAKIMEPEKCTKIGWFKWNNLPKPLFLPIKNLLKLKVSFSDLKKAKLL